MPDRDDGAIGAAERRKVSLVDIAKKLGGIILDDGELWRGDERREDEKRAMKKPAETGSAPKERSPCDFFG